MEWRIPFFYYDVFARIIPGTLTLAVLQHVGVDLPTPWRNLLSGASGAETTSSLLVAAVSWLAAAYAIGVLFEAVSYLPPLQGLTDWVVDRAFKSAAGRRGAWRRPLAGSPRTQTELRDVRRHLNNWVMTSPAAGCRNAFFHVHRFQAESRMCQYALIPLLVFAIGTAIKGLWAHAALGAVGALLVGFGYRQRERRRWVQALVTLDELNDYEQPDLRELQRNCQAFGTHGGAAIPSASKCGCPSVSLRLRRRCSGRGQTLRLSFVVRLPPRVIHK